MEPHGSEADIMFQMIDTLINLKSILEGYYKVDLRIGYVTDNLEITAFIDNAFDDTKTRSGMALQTSLI